MPSSSDNKKKVHYTASTKGKSSHSHSKGHSHKSSRDSGVGSSSASDRASLGTSPNDSPFNSQEIQFQRHNPTALAEALDAANEKIRQLEEANEHLKYLLKESNREKRSFKEEREDAIKECENLGHDLAEEKKAHDKLRREVGRAKPAISSSRHSPPASHRHSREDEHSYASGESTRRYFVPQPPPNAAPNPFIPLNERVAYAPATTVSYSPAMYSTAPAFGGRPAGTRTSGSSYGPKDGNYHSLPI